MKTTLTILVLAASITVADAQSFTTSGKRTPAELRRNIGECLIRLQNEPMAREICDAEQLVTNTLGVYKPKDRTRFAACMRQLPKGRFATQSRAICADSDATSTNATTPQTPPHGCNPGANAGTFCLEP